MQFQLRFPLGIHRIRRFLKKRKRNEIKGVGVRIQGAEYISCLSYFLRFCSQSLFLKIIHNDIKQKDRY